MALAAAISADWGRREASPDDHSTPRSPTVSLLRATPLPQRRLSTIVVGRAGGAGSDEAQLAGQPPVHLLHRQRGPTCRQNEFAACCFRCL